jgi:RNA 2',3'-cyclic 3'-phosphodiesterase
MRLFVAVVLSDENQQRLRVPVDRLVRAHANVLRTIPDQTAHMTMAFLGAVEERDVAAIGEAMQEVARPRGPIAIELSGPRVLRARQDPRLIMLPVTTGAMQLDAIANDLHRGITARLKLLNLSPAKGAHVTLARFRKDARPSDARAVEQSLGSSDLASLVLHDEVRELRLFESRLGAGGPQYRQLHSARFNDMI